MIGTSFSAFFSIYPVICEARIPSSIPGMSTRLTLSLMMRNLCSRAVSCFVMISNSLNCPESLLFLTSPLGVFPSSSTAPGKLLRCSYIFAIISLISCLYSRALLFWSLGSIVMKVKGALSELFELSSLNRHKLAVSLKAEMLKKLCIFVEEWRKVLFPALVAPMTINSNL